MNRIVESQLIGSTRVDLNGDRIEPERAALWFLVLLGYIWVNVHA